MSELIGKGDRDPQAEIQKNLEEANSKYIDKLEELKKEKDGIQDLIDRYEEALSIVRNGLNSISKPSKHE